MAQPPLLLIPGLLCDAALWQHQIEQLANDATIVVADTLQDSSIPDMAKRAIDTMDQRFPESTFAVAGLSMGGYIALAMWQQAAERINRLALLDTRAGKESAESQRKRERLMKMVQFHQRFVGMTDDQLPLYIHPDRVADTALVDLLRQMTQRVGKTAYLRQQQAIIDRPSSLDMLSRISVPTLIICGEADAITPVSCSEEMAAQIPGAALHIIPDCGHLSSLEKPETVTALLREWLS